MNIHFDPESKDSIAAAKAPTDERMMAYVYAHAGMTDESRAKLKEMQSIDKLDLGRYLAIREGYPIALTEQERTKMIASWEHFQMIVNWVRATGNPEARGK